ncbi:hypothetical protein [Pontibacillus sp. HMF3514]|uniref:hypothetical protein n=1 Tax=Pontibacillus sp. HMF3514 TaxID=2692425 RepID=UPI00131F6557|nr:hypothetical protein [Pontibacillus sp. HMF3514]QHE51915.1 hypothetical protein GS400_07675 [Pontibacillus sp. HMF3514]
MLAILANIGFTLLVVYIIYLVIKKNKRDKLMLHKDKTSEEIEAEQNVTREKAKSWRVPPNGGGGGGM